MEYLIASIAVSEGKKSSTATSLFSFFLSVQINFVKAEYSNLNLKFKFREKEKERKKESECINNTIFKETPNFSKAMRGKFFDVSVMLILWIISTDRDQLVIFLTL